jgi:hypothetical protein
MIPFVWNGINPQTGLPFAWNTPNLTWAGLLEPGDPGYVPVPSLIQTLKPRKHTMPKSDFLATDDNGKATQFVLFRDNVGQFLATLGILATDPDIVQQAADAARFRAIVDFCNNMQNAAQGWTAEKNYERDGGATAPSGQVVPVLPAGFPAAVPAGIVARFRALVKRLKAIASCTPTIRQALGIEGTEQTGPDMAILQAILTLSIIGNAVLIGWGWQGFSAFLDMLEIQVDRGDGKGWVFLTYDTTPNYTDTFPLPATPAKWKYRAIYRVGDAQVGVWSDTKEIMVGV